MNAPLIGLLLLFAAVLLFFAGVATIFHWCVQWFKARREKKRPPALPDVSPEEENNP